MIPCVLDAVLVFALAIPVVMQYRIYPMEGTPYGLFGLLFLILLLNIVISYAPDVLGKAKKHLHVIKLSFVIAAICISLGGSAVTAMADRARVAPVWGVHDIVLQEEAAMRYLLNGKNPYKETYFGTPVESFNYDEPGNTEAVNPALYHFVMPPWYLIFPFAAYYTWRPLVGFFDARMALVITMGMLLAALWWWFKDKSLARIAIIFATLSPSVVPYFIEGRSDVFALSWLMASFVFLYRKKYVWSGILMALAVLSKQTIWFVLPFYIPFMWHETAKKRKIFFISAVAFSSVVFVLVLPFIVWDARAFFDSVILYLSGNTAHSYPVSGYGLGMVLSAAGIITDLHAYYPFILWQAVICVPLFFLLYHWVMKSPSQSRVMLAYAVFLMVFWYLSRYFNNSHLGYLSIVFVLGALKGIDEKDTA